MEGRVSRRAFGTLESGENIELVTLRTGGGVEARIMTYGATLQALIVPDRDGVLEDVVLGHDEFTGYVESRDFFGATIGRFANRIAKGRFSIDGEDYLIPPNDGQNALHGGSNGFDRHVWQIEAIDDDPEPSVTLHRLSVDGEGGFPGALDVRVTYALRGEADLDITFEARSERSTIVNLTNHAYFNLGGAQQVDSILSHRVRIEADHYLPIDASSIPEGGPASVEGTPFDFRRERAIGEQVRQASHEQIKRGRGYDHNFCLRDGVVKEPRLAARVEHGTNGRVLELWTDQPGVQFYSGNFLDGTVTGKNGQSYRMGDAFCLEPQHWPDTPNRPDFPSARLDAGDVYRHRSIYKLLTN